MTTTASTRSSSRSSFVPGERETLLLAVIVLGVAIFLTVGIVTMNVHETAKPPGPKVFPIIITIVAYVTSVLLAASVLLGRARRGSSPSDTHSPAPVASEQGDLAARDQGAVGSDVDSAGATALDVGEERTDLSWRHLAILFVSFVVFVIALVPLGWLISATVVFFGATMALGAKPSLRSFAVAIILAALIQLIFSGWLGLSLPTGFIGGL